MSIRGRRLLKGGVYFDLNVNGVTYTRRWRLFGARYLLEEIRCVRSNNCINNYDVLWK